jgi:glucokinase
MLVGVDFGGTQVKAGIVEGGDVVRSMTAETRPGASVNEVLSTLTNVALALAPRPIAVGVAIPGEVDGEGRCWRLTNVPGFEGVHIARELGERLNCPIAVENDATAAALGERLYGHGREYPSFLMITLGTGIGGGLVLGHALYPGTHGFAGEVGHMNVMRALDAPVCACGQRGCIEAYAGTKALIRRYRELGGGSADEILPISVAARRGEQAALRVFEEMGEALGRGLANIQNLLDLNAIVFSGGVSQSFDLIEPYVRRALRECAFAPPLAEVPLLVSELGERAGVIGAAHLTEL